MNIVLTIVVGLVSGLLGIISKLGLDSLVRINETRSIAAMLAAEIRAMQATIELRQYIPTLHSYIAAYEAGQNPRMRDFIRDPSVWDSVYRTALLKVGGLGPSIASPVSRFYQLMRGLMLDVTNFTEWQDEMDAVEKIAFIQNMLLVWRDANSTADHAVALLDAYARHSGFSILRIELLRGL